MYNGQQHDWQSNSMNYMNQAPSHHQHLQHQAVHSPVHHPIGTSSSGSTYPSHDIHRMPSPVVHLNRMYDDGGDSSMYHHQHTEPNDWSPHHPTMPAPVRHTHSAAPSLGHYQPSTSSYPPHPSLHTRAASISAVNTHPDSPYMSNVTATHSFVPSHLGPSHHQSYNNASPLSHSPSSAESERNSSISPPLKHSEGTLSPPTTVGSTSSSENLKLAHPSAMMSTRSTNADADSQATEAQQQQPPKQKYPGAKRGRKPKPPPTPEQAAKNREAYLEKNRIAALHSRQRKKVKNGRLEQHAEDLAAKNQQLQQFARDLHVELMQLRALLARLPPGGFPDVEAYLDREKKGGGIPTIMTIAGPTLERDYTYDQ